MKFGTRYWFLHKPVILFIERSAYMEGGGSAFGGSAYGGIRRPGGCLTPPPKKRVECTYSHSDPAGDDHAMRYMYHTYLTTDPSK